MNDRIIKGLLLGLFAILLAGCGSDGPDVEAVTSFDEDSSTASADEPLTEGSESSTAVPSEPLDESESSGQSESTVRSVVSQPEPAQFLPDATLLAHEFAPAEPGTYRVNTLGTPISFTLDEPSLVPRNSHGAFVLTHPRSQGRGDRDTIMFRLTHLVDPSDPTMDITAETFFDTDWPSDDFGGWLDNLSDDVVVTDRAETSLGGRAVLRADLELGAEAPCGPGTFECALVGTNMLFVRVWIAPGAKHRVWIVDQDDDVPLAIVANIKRESDTDYFDTVEALLSTLAFGDVAPNLVEYAPPGSIEEASFLGGIRAELTEEGMRLREPVARISVLDTAAETAFLTNPLDLDGMPLTTADELIAALDQVDAELTELESTTVGGLDARVLDIGVSSWRPALSILPGSEAIWEIPPRARAWIIEHPDRGVLMITAEAFRDVDEVFPVILAYTEPIVESLEFVDLDGDNGPSPTDLNGTWEGSNGVTWVIENSKISVSGGAVNAFSYTATDTTIDLIDVSCGPTRPGMYEWTIADDVLSLVLMSDECEGRSDALDGVSFERTE